MSVPISWSRVRGASILSSCLLSLTLASPLAFAQTPSAPTPEATAAALENYRDISWTGGAASAVISRKEAGAALAEGRRNCRSEHRGKELKACLQLVNDDHREMLARARSASARR